MVQRYVLYDPYLTGAERQNLLNRIRHDLTVWVSEKRNELLDWNEFATTTSKVIRDAAVQQLAYIIPGTPLNRVLVWTCQTFLSYLCAPNEYFSTVKLISMLACLNGIYDGDKISLTDDNIQQNSINTTGTSPKSSRDKKSQVSYHSQAFIASETLAQGILLISLTFSSVFSHITSTFSWYFPDIYYQCFILSSIHYRSGLVTSLNNHYDLNSSLHRLIGLYLCPSLRAYIWNLHFGDLQ